MYSSVLFIFVDSLVRMDLNVSHCETSSHSNILSVHENEKWARNHISSYVCSSESFLIRLYRKLPFYKHQVTACEKNDIFRLEMIERIFPSLTYHIIFYNWILQMRWGWEKIIENIEKGVKKPFDLIHWTWFWYVNMIKAEICCKLVSWWSLNN